MTKAEEYLKQLFDSYNYWDKLLEEFLERGETINSPLYEILYNRATTANAQYKAAAELMRLIEAEKESK